MGAGADALATLAAMGTAVKSIAEAVAAARKAIPSAKRAPADEYLVKVNDLILALQARQIELQGQILQLQEGNGQLREQVRQHEARTLDREGYERRQLGGATVYVPKDSPGTYLCATCFEAGTKSYLLPEAIRRRGTHKCAKCRAYFRLPPRAP